MFGHGNADLRKISSVENDYVNAMEKAVDYLWGIGHRRIAYLSGLTVQQSYDLRIEGYQRAMATRSAGQIAEELCICSAKLTNTDISDGKVLAKKLIDRNADASAVICTNDLMAIGALQVFREAGLDVPGDISVLGIDGASFGEIVTPRLTTMGVSYHEIGQKAFGLLYSDLQNNTKGFFRNVPELVIRESTAPPHIHANFGA